MVVDCKGVRMSRVPSRSRLWLALSVALATIVLVAACGSSQPSAVAPSAGASSSSGSSPASAPGSLPPPSAIGAPTGPAVTKVIGAAGGDLSAADGGVTVTIPAGALAADTKIEIQAVEDTTPDGSGISYSLSPNGQTFSQPVQVSFAATDAALDGTSLEALGIAFQDEAGRWEWQPSVTADAAAKRVSVMTTHFSHWSLLAGLQLRPKRASVRVKKTITIVADVCQPVLTGYVWLAGCQDATNDDLAPLIPSVKSATWSVNGQVGGSAATGTVRGGKASAVFTAPAKKPGGSGGRSVVTVSVAATVNGRPTELVSNITITGGDYTVVGTFVDNNSSLACAGAVSPLVRDTVSFSLTSSDTGALSVTDIVNSKTTAKPVKLPVPVPELSAKLVSPPEILTANDGAVSVNGDQVTVVISGPFTLGVCRFSGNGGSVLGTGDTHDSATGIIFDTTMFVGGKQTGSADKPQWTWIITEQ